MSLAELNEARKIARTLGIEGAAKMKLAALKDAIDAAQDDERQFAATMQREEDEQDTPEAAAAYERAMTPPMPDVIGTCEGCGEAIAAVDEGVEMDEAGMWCESCMVQPQAGPSGVRVAEAKGDGTDETREEAIARVRLETGESEEIVAEAYDALVSMDEEAALVEKYEGDPNGDGVDPTDEPRADCFDPDCAAAARERDAVETREDARTRIISEDRSETRAVLDVTVERRGFRHLAIPGLHVTLCMKARPTGRLGKGTLDSVDCLDCLDKIVELASRP